ncbi:MAG: phosphoglycerate dehydrogenase, partial [Cytophagales bacterium]|nr:phosphoglycerate dehydrogenase [Cytophagales bacterium]
QSKIKIDSSFLDLAPKLKFVARSGSGLDLIDTEELKRRGIQLISSPEGNRNAVGEHTVGIILALLNHFVKADQEVRKFIWDREGNRGHELINKTVAIIGYGNMGQSVASKLQVFGCKILVYDKYHTGFKHSYVSESTMDQVFEESDIVTFHIPLTTETKLMVNESYLSHFKKPIWLINAARGEILDTKALIYNLESGKIIAAGLDVLENEKLSTLTQDQRTNLEKLASMNNVLLSPHVAGWSHESNIRNNEVLASKIAAIN